MIVIHDLFDVFCFLLQMDLQLLIKIDLVLLCFHLLIQLPLMLFLLLQFNQVSCMLLCSKLPLILLPLL